MENMLVKLQISATSLSFCNQDFVNVTQRVHGWPVEFSSLPFMSICKSNPVLWTIQSHSLRKCDMLHSSSSSSQTMTPTSSKITCCICSSCVYVPATVRDKSISTVRKHSVQGLKKKKHDLHSHFNLARTKLAFFLVSVFSSCSSSFFPNTTSPGIISAYSAPSSCMLVEFYMHWTFDWFMNLTLNILVMADVSIFSEFYLILFTVQACVLCVDKCSWSWWSCV